MASQRYIQITHNNRDYLLCFKTKFQDHEESYKIGNLIEEYKNYDKYEIPAKEIDDLLDCYFLILLEKGVIKSVRSISEEEYKDASAYR